MNIYILLYCFTKFSDLNFCCLSPPIRGIVEITVKLAPFCTVHSCCCFPSYLDRFLIVDDCKKKNDYTFLNDKLKAKLS